MAIGSAVCQAGGCVEEGPELRFNHRVAEGASRLGVGVGTRVCMVHCCSLGGVPVEVHGWWYVAPFVCFQDLGAVLGLLSVVRNDAFTAFGAYLVNAALSVIAQEVRDIIVSGVGVGCGALDVVCVGVRKGFVEA